MSSAPAGGPEWLALLREQRYRRRFHREDGRLAIVVTAVIAVGYTVTAVNDYLVLRGSPLLGVSLAARGLLLAAAATTIAFLRRARWPREQDRAVHIELLSTAILVSIVHLTKIPSGQVVAPVLGSFTALCVIYFGQRGPVVPRALAATALVIVAAAILLLAAPSTAFGPAARVGAVICLVALDVVGYSSARSLEEQRRMRFEAERRERRAREELDVRLRELVFEKDRAEAATRARTAFLAAMSHELRTPMNAVIGLSDELLAVPLDAPFTADRHESVRVMNDSARALLALVNDVLDFAKIDAHKLSLSPAPFDLRALATSVIEMLRPAAAARSIALAAEVSPDVPPWLVADAARLRQVLVNLVSNAVKFTERGAVSLRVEANGAKRSWTSDAAGEREGAGPPRPGIEAHAREGDLHVIDIRVEDTGIGMSPDVLARLFRPFEQGDEGIARRYGGTGLGLAISLQIVAAMGGDIHVESTPGRGSVFSFTLRLARSEAVVEPTAPPPPGERTPLAILVVDDHSINRVVARAKFRRLGYAVEMACDGSEAVLAASRKDYDVIFMDLHMPEMSGIEAAERIAAAFDGKQAPRIVAMTASVFEEDRRACWSAGMRDFVAKPIDLRELDAVLARVAEERGATKPLLARGALDELWKIERLGAPGFFESVCHAFLADTRQRVARLEEAHARGDARAIEHEAHALKSASATLGATEMSETCARLEHAARQGRLDDVAPDVRALPARFEEVERAVARELQRVPDNAAPMDRA